MKLFIKLFLLTTLAAGLMSCGADKFKQPSTPSSKSKLSAGLTCNCNFLYSPVCGSDGKNYDNNCIAECKQVTVSKVGHCACSNDLMVCGSDGQNHPECEAVNSKTYQIIKYVPCGAAEL